MHLAAISINKSMKSFGGLEHSYDFIIYPVTNVIRQFAYTSGIYTMVVLTLERYFAICHPEKSKDFNTPSRTKLLIGKVVDAKYSSAHTICLFVCLFVCMIGL